VVKKIALFDESDSAAFDKLSRGTRRGKSFGCAPGANGSSQAEHLVATERFFTATPHI
jgi:hypothetical protein